MQIIEEIQYGIKIYRLIGGHGILIIRKLMDNVSYERRQGKNKLTMKKNIKAKW